MLSKESYRPTGIKHINKKYDISNVVMFEIQCLYIFIALEKTTLYIYIYIYTLLYNIATFFTLLSINYNSAGIIA